MNAEFAGRHVVVMGLGRFGGGVGVSKWLARQGARLLITDQADANSLSTSVAQLEGLDVTLRLGSHDEADLEGADLLVVSPAVDKRKSTFLQAALRRGIPLTSEMNLFLERCPGRIIGVTGTVGKSTTAAMLYTILKSAASRGELGGAEVKFGGNIGQSLLGDLDGITPRDLVVLELSSFQLEDAGPLRWSPPIALMTNVSPHHLDRHGTLEEYLRCKLNLCRYQKPTDAVLWGTDDPVLERTLRLITAQTGATLVHAPAEVSVVLSVPGRHNRRNAALAWTVAERLGIAPSTIRESLEAFSGLPHRLQFVDRLNGAAFFNDSKATTPGGVAVALESFNRPVILICGGQDKSASWTLVEQLKAGRIKRAICMGENRLKLAAILGAEAVETLPEAVAAARAVATEGDVVLFSPGAPSYDQFVNYEARGEAFSRLVTAAV